MKDDVRIKRDATAARPALFGYMPDLTIQTEEETAETASAVRFTQGNSWLTGVGMNIDNKTRPTSCSRGHVVNLKAERPRPGNEETSFASLLLIVAASALAERADREKPISLRSQSHQRRRCKEKSRSTKVMSCSRRARWSLLRQACRHSGRRWLPEGRRLRRPRRTRPLQAETRRQGRVHRGRRRAHRARRAQRNHRVLHPRLGAQRPRRGQGNYISYDGLHEKYQVTSGVSADGKGPPRRRAAASAPSSSRRAKQRRTDKRRPADPETLRQPAEQGVSTMPYELILAEQRGRVGLITLNRRSSSTPSATSWSRK